MVDLNALQSRVEQVSSVCRRDSKLLIFSLSSSIESNSAAFWGGVRVSDLFVIISLVNVSQLQLVDCAPVLSRYADYIFVDAEKKHPFEIGGDTSACPEALFSNLLSAALILFDGSTVFPWSPSRITSQATVARVRELYGGNLSGATCSVIGLGNIGFKIALHLIEEGCNVTAFGRNQDRLSKLVDCINLVKSDFTLASAVPARNLDLAMARSRAAVLAANSESYISKRQLQLMSSPQSDIIDVSKSSLDLEARQYVHNAVGISYLRLDIGVELVNMVGSALRSLAVSPDQAGPARVEYALSKSGFCVSGGFPGLPGDCVVDNAHNPVFILGYLDDNLQFVSDFGVVG